MLHLRNSNTRVSLLPRLPWNMFRPMFRSSKLIAPVRASRFASSNITAKKPKTNDEPNDGTPSSYNIPPKESMTDDKLPESQNEHPGPIHKDGEEKKGK